MRASLLVYIMRNCPENDRNGWLLFKFRSQADPVPVTVGGSQWREEGLWKIPIDGQPRRPRRFKNSGFTSSRVQSRVVPVEWKPVDDERGIDGQSARWQATASSQLYNLHALEETNGTYTVPKVGRKWKFRFQSVKSCLKCNAIKEI